GTATVRVPARPRSGCRHGHGQGAGTATVRVPARPRSGCRHGHGQGADAATVSDRATSDADGTRVVARALGDAESVGDAEPVGDAGCGGAGGGAADGVRVAGLDGAGDGDGAAGGDAGEPEPEPEPEPDCGWEGPIRPVGAVAEIHGTLGAVNAGGE